MLSFDQALARILHFAQPSNSQLGTETVPLAMAANRVLASDVEARLFQPPFDASAMDGYAVASAQTEIDHPYSLIGESQAGARFAGELKSGETVRIFTGAPVPRGADAVIIQENATRGDDDVCFSQGAEPGQNVRVRGQDFSQNDILLESGQTLPPAALALAAAGNSAELRVFKRPKVALLSTGSELVPPGSEVLQDQIIGSNIYALKPLFSPWAEKVLDFGVAADDTAGLKTALETALNSESDIIVTTGGASVGDHDLVQPVLKFLGAKIDFWKIAMRPGKPVILATLGKKLILALPGNPVSAFVTAATLAVPALRAMAGLANPAPTIWRLPLASALPSNGPRRHFMRGRLETVDGVTSVRPIMQTDSAHLSSLAQANVLLMHLENATELRTGEMIAVLPLSHAGQ